MWQHYIKLEYIYNIPILKYSAKSWTIEYKCTICAQSFNKASTVRETVSAVPISYWK